MQLVLSVLQGLIKEALHHREGFLRAKILTQANTLLLFMCAISHVTVQCVLVVIFNNRGGQFNNSLISQPLCTISMSIVKS
jgi:hypothetical protein